MITTPPIPLPLLLLFLTFLFPICTLATDVINTNQPFTDRDSLVSSGGAFRLGFFTPAYSNRRYLGIWFNTITDFTVVWVANRDAPVLNSSATVLNLVLPGTLNLLDATNSLVWSSNSSSPSAKSPMAQLLDTGNFVIREENDYNPKNYIWQSFDNPTDTLLAGMNLGFVAKGKENYLTSWKSNDDPGTGPYNYHLDPTGYPQAVLRRNSTVLSRTGPWNGVGFSGLPGLRRNPLYIFDLIMEGDAVYYRYDLQNQSTVTRFVMNQSGGAQRWTWIDRSQGWAIYMTAPIDNCDTYDQCRAHGVCDVLNSPVCGCLDKFEPRFPSAWAEADWSGGCVRRTPLNCSTDGFVKYSQLKFPDAKTSWVKTGASLAECESICRRNCSCTAYATLDIRNGGSGCLFWSEKLLDIRRVYGIEQDIFIRMASSDLDNSKKKKKGSGVLIGSLCAAIGGIILLGILFYICQRRKIYSKLKKGGLNTEQENNDVDLPTLFNLSKISKATDDFSLNNKLGEGGFGHVYKGTLEDGQEIAIKRLSKTSFQGLDEFKNEVMCIARLQHRNLVKLLGCCVGGEEKMLIYEYMPNKSLDLILFDETKRKLLDWPKRFNIIVGIARGLMYLHQDSRLRIIHRDLKASNILLDIDMNPKISDFGMARIVGGNETEANTSRVVGTYGYMSPEYTTDGIFSTKSDVYSFGVVLLEIVSGQRNRRFSHEDHHHNLLGHAWVLHKEENSLNIVQDDIVESCSIFEVLRSIHVGLLCVQAYPEDRPSMSSVVNMLENDAVLPPPRQPGFFMEGDHISSNDNSLSTKASSKNEISITVIQPR